MGRRTSGWTVLKKVAREVDRVNRAHTREKIRVQKQHLRIVESVCKKGELLGEQFNRLIKAADEATTVNAKESKLREARARFAELKSMADTYDFVGLQNLEQVKERLLSVEVDLKKLQQQEAKKQQNAEFALLETQEASALRQDIENILRYTLRIDDAIAWDELYDTAAFTCKKPVLASVPAKPDKDASEYNPAISFLVKIFKRAHLLTQNLAFWIQQKQPLLWGYLRLIGVPEKRSQTVLQAEKNLYEKDLKDWEENADTTLRKNEQALNAWEKRKKDFIAAQENYNNVLNALRSQYEKKEKNAVAEYCRLVLSRSCYPFQFQRDFQVDYANDTKIAVIDYTLPNIDVVPSLKEARFVKSSGDIKRTFITDKQHQELYESMLYAMVLRIVHEIFEADVVDAIETVVLNGWVNTVDPATGNPLNPCILSINFSKKEFVALSLESIVPKECFKKFKGLSAARLSELVPVAPILQLNKNDARFVGSYDVCDTIADGDNLASMHWEDFEHLIREIFEREFAAHGGEVRVTQASRDGGVDAVIFDPDPIRGGKIIVQAKRYTNIVGVSAVRDLYGTVMNEGATKGILVTTANYGADAFNFAKDKPLTLLNGSHLLHLLEKHGKKARIDLAEAKRSAVA